MKAVAVFPATREVKIVEHEAPRIASPTQVMLRILDVGVCGTDREICSFQYGTPPAGSPYLVLGHESLGEVVETGAAVAGLKPGDLVVTMVRRPCVHGHCLACRSDRQDFCFTGEFVERGINGAHGFMTEFVVDDQKFMNRVPRELRAVGVLVEPLTIAEKGLAQVRDVQDRLPWGPTPPAGKEPAYRHRAVVLGAGPVGLLGAMALITAGFHTWVYSREPAPGPKCALVESIGAKYVSAGTDDMASLAKQVGSIDLIYEATGASRASFELLKYLGTNGVYVFTGVPGRKAPVEIDTDFIMRNIVLKNQVVLGTVNAGKGAFEAAIRDLGTFMKRWPEAVKALITGRHPIGEARDLLTNAPGGIKEVVAIGG